MSSVRDSNFVKLLNYLNLNNYEYVKNEDVEYGVVINYKVLGDESIPIKIESYSDESFEIILDITFNLGIFNLGIFNRLNKFSRTFGFFCEVGKISTLDENNYTTIRLIREFGSKHVNKLNDFITDLGAMHLGMSVLLVAIDEEYDLHNFDISMFVNMSVNMVSDLQCLAEKKEYVYGSWDALLHEAGHALNRDEYSMLKEVTEACKKFETVNKIKLVEVGSIIMDKISSVEEIKINKPEDKYSIQ